MIYEEGKSRKIFTEKSIQKKRIQKAIEMIKEAKKPYIFVGGGAVLSEASQELKEFVDK